MAPENDIDYSLSRVPDEAKQPFWRILFIRIGAICCVSQLMLGAALGYGLTFWDAFLATMLGSVLLQVVSWALGTAAAREGLSTSLLSRWTGFGKVGSALFGGVVAISMVGWFGVQNAVFGQGMAEIVPFTDFLGTQEILPGIMAGITPEYIFWAIITGLGITLLVVFGIKAIANFATVFVPLFVIVVIVAAAIILQNHSLTELLTTAPPGPALSLGAATTMVAGGFIAGAICTPDYARFLKNGTQVFWMTLIGTFVGELGMNLLAVLLAHAMGTENIVDIMMGTSGIIGVIIVVASTVKLNDINLYSSSLGLATMINALFNKAISRNGLVWAGRSGSTPHRRENPDQQCEAPDQQCEAPDVSRETSGASCFAATSSDARSCVGLRFMGAAPDRKGRGDGRAGRGCAGDNRPLRSGRAPHAAPLRPLRPARPPRGRAGCTPSCGPA